MKYSIFFVILSAIVSFTSCNNGNPNAADSKQVFGTTNIASSASSASAVFSYNLDGTRISGGEVDELMMNNAAFPTKSANKLSFFLNDAYKDKTETFSHSLRFAIPDKTGAVTIKEGDENWNVELFLSAGDNTKYTLYGNENFLVNITNISASRVSGTFSGKVKLVEGQGSGKNELAITDGKFDIPVRETK